jgi:hypothetical protein
MGSETETVSDTLGNTAPVKQVLRVLWRGRLVARTQRNCYTKEITGILIMNTIVLTRKQLHQLREIAERFVETQNFTIESESLSGIGKTISVRFDLFEKADTKIDITDVENW